MAETFNCELGTPSRARTGTRSILSRLPLPIGLWGLAPILRGKRLVTPNATISPTSKNIAKQVQTVTNRTVFAHILTLSTHAADRLIKVEDKVCLARGTD